MDTIVGAIIGVGGIVLGALIGAVVTSRVLPQQARRELAAKNRDAAAAYLEAIAATLEAMAHSFSSNRIPYEHGHTFQRLVDSYEPKIKPYLGEGASADLRKLQAIAQRAEAHDGALAAGDKADATALLADIWRMIGDLRAMAVTLQATPT